MGGNLEPSLKYFFRIANVLAENQSIGISRLVSLAGINHQRCCDILEPMEMYGLISIERSERRGRRRVMVTDKGSQYFKNLSSIPLPPFDNHVAQSEFRRAIM